MSLSGEAAAIYLAVIAAVWGLWEFLAHPPHEGQKPWRLAAQLPGLVLVALVLLAVAAP